MLNLLHESCEVNLFNKHVMLELRGFDIIINKLGFFFLLFFIFLFCFERKDTNKLGLKWW